MGQLVSKFVDQLDESSKKETNMEAILETLMDLGKAKQDLQKLYILNQLTQSKKEDNLFVPITKVLKFYSYVYVNATDDTNGVKEVVGSAIDTIVSITDGNKDGLIGGITKIVNNSLDVILGSSSGEVKEEELYFITTEALAIVRYDLVLYSKFIKATSIQSKMKRIVVATISKSSVDVSKIDLNTFLSVYSMLLSKMNIAEEELEKRITKARDVYLTLSTPVRSPLLNVANINTVETRDE